MKTTNKATTRSAFTLVELLVVITIIALLVGITLVATTKALRAGEVTATKYLMESISEGIEQFHADLGYYPPLLRDDLGFDEPERFLLEAQPDANELFRSYRHFSITTLPTYLVGVGRIDPAELADSPYGADRHDGHAGPGIRNPGPDRSWGGALDRANQSPTTSGRVYGPYVDVGDGDSMRGISMGDFASVNADDNPRYIGLGNANSPNGPDTNLYLFQDAWEVPIRYYQPRWPRRNELTGALTLDHVPAELLSVDAINVDFQPEGDREILSANYALLSAGPNRDFIGRTVDQGVNEDLSIVPMTDERNTDLFEVLDDTPRSSKKRRELIRGISDNIRIIK